MTYLLHHLLLESAARYPDRDAVVREDERITYAELETESNRLAHTLLERGVERGDRVGIFLNRGIPAIVALFGILKVGGTYVPIDPLAPSNRIGYILDKCGIRHLLTTREKIKNIGPWPLNEILVMDGLDPDSRSSGTTKRVDWREIRETAKKTLPEPRAIESDPAYILFTSGSTGTPKGVILSHRNALTFIETARDFFGIERDDRLSNLCPLHFDMSVFDLFVAFKAGATVVIIPEIDTLFPIKLAGIIEQKGITVWNSVPSALSLLAAYKNLPSHDLSSLRWVLFAGEPFPPKYLRRLQEIIPGAGFCNLYGQTEANSSTCYRVTPEEKNPLPIGKPLPNFDLFILDEEGRQVTTSGKEGELYVRGGSVALGYWGEPERTEKAFVKNPLRPELNERVYRTGDRVRIDPDGNYIFLGRQDQMIKSRGYRIEMGEIETVLSNHPEIRHAVVIPIPDELIGNRISVVVIPSKPGTVSREGVLEYCSARLPRYMVPEIVEFRDTLPMTSSGKVDRKRLTGETSSAS